MTGVTVVTGGGQGIGRAIVERLLADGGSVVVLELRADDLAWTTAYGGRIAVVTGDAGEDAVATEAVGRARTLGGLTGWVSNAALFSDAWLHQAGGAAVAELVRRNLQPALAGAAAAVVEFRALARPARSSTCRRTRLSGRSGAPWPTRPQRPRSRD